MQLQNLLCNGENARTVLQTFLARDGHQLNMTSLELKACGYFLKGFFGQSERASEVVDPFPNVLLSLLQKSAIFSK